MKGWMKKHTEVKGSALSQNQKKTHTSEGMGS